MYGFSPLIAAQGEVRGALCCICAGAGVGAAGKTIGGSAVMPALLGSITAPAPVVEGVSPGATTGGGGVPVVVTSPPTVNTDDANGDPSTGPPLLVG